MVKKACLNWGMFWGYVSGYASGYVSRHVSRYVLGHVRSTGLLATGTLWWYVSRHVSEGSHMFLFMNS